MAEGITSKAAILEELGKPLVIDDIIVPDAVDLKCGQILVRIRCSGICGSQIGEISAKEDKYLPHLLGHEGGGVVKGIGSGVTQVNVGDHVVMHWRKGSGIESDFPQYIWRDKIIGGGRVTTFSEYAVVSENRLTPIEKNIPFDVAALMGCCVTTGLGVVLNEAKLKPGQSIAIIGCGGVGLNVIQAASMVSAFPIYAFDINEIKLDLAKNFGATNAYNLTEGPIVFGNVDVVVDCTGIMNLIETGLSITASRGCMILVGLPHSEQNPTIQLSNMRQHFTGKKIIFSEGGLTNPTEDIPRYLNLYRKGILKLDNLITHRFKLEQVNEAIETVKSGDCGKVVLEMG